MVFRISAVNAVQYGKAVHEKIKQLRKNEEK